MSTMLELHNRWRGFTAERAKARQAVDQKIEANNAEIERLRQENVDLDTQFTNHWAKTKKELQEARDRAVMDIMAGPDGKSGQWVLRELGSRNTVWIYDLRKRLAAEGRLVDPLNENSSVERLRMSARPKEAAAPAAPAEPDFLKDITWLSHGHQGVVGWLISTDYRYIKMYATDGVLEGEWFVCEDKSYTFVAGNEDLFKDTKRSEIVRKTNLLKSILDDTYGGTIKEVDNPYID